VKLELIKSGYRTAVDTAELEINIEPEIILTSAPPSPYSASFTVNSSTLRTEEEIEFINTSEGDVAKYLWMFGDGAHEVTDNKVSVKHIYATAGVKNVELYLVMETGAVVGKTETQITIVEHPLGSLGVNFTYSIIKWNRDGVDFVIDENGMVDVFFNNRSDDAFTQFVWQFGDGTSPYVQDEKSHVSHDYLPGTYTVQLIGVAVTRTERITRIKKQTITITEDGEFEKMVLPDPSFTVSDTELFIDPQTEYAEITVSNTISSSAEGLNNVREYVWSCNGGIMSNESSQGATIRFQYPGLYDVSLTVVGNSGNSSDRKRSTCRIRVLEGDIAIVADKTYGKAPLKVNFRAVSSVPLPSDVIYKWDFKSRLGLLYGEEVTYTYRDQRPNTQTYTVTLEVIDRGIVIGSDTEWITVVGYQSDAYGYGYGDGSSVAPR
jgi:PKD repeat protein